MEEMLAHNKHKNGAGLQRNVGISFGGLACKVKQSFSQYYVVQYQGATFTLIHFEWHPLEQYRVAWAPLELCYETVLFSVGNGAVDKGQVQITRVLNTIEWYVCHNFTLLKPGLLAAPHRVLLNTAPQNLTIKQHVSCLDTSWPNICSMSLLSGCVSAADVVPLARINTGYYSRV